MAIACTPRNCPYTFNIYVNTPDMIKSIGKNIIVINVTVNI